MHFVEILGPGTPLELVQIPSGEFVMGAPALEEGFRVNEAPLHVVNLPSFYLGKYPITQKQWIAIMGKLPDMKKRFIGDELPVVNVWLDLAIEFCDRLSRSSQLSYRLPTEAEWEYACRSTTTTPFCFGQTISSDIANFDARQPYGRAGTGPFRNSTSAVGSLGIANDFGLYDMHGNVWEWCGDDWHADYSMAPVDGSAWLDGGDPGYCVQRGGSWTDRAINCRSAFRVGDIARNADNIVGLRVCAS